MHVTHLYRCHTAAPPCLQLLACGKVLQKYSKERAGQRNALISFTTPSTPHTPLYIHSFIYIARPAHALPTARTQAYRQAHTAFCYPHFPFKSIIIQRGKKNRGKCKKKEANIWMDIKSPYLCSVLERQLIVLLKKFQDTMKKLVFMFVAFAAISFASCGNKTSEAPATDSVAADSAVVDSAAADSVVADSAATDSAAQA